MLRAVADLVLRQRRLVKLVEKLTGVLHDLDGTIHIGHLVVHPAHALYDGDRDLRCLQLGGGRQAVFPLMGGGSLPRPRKAL